MRNQTCRKIPLKIKSIATNIILSKSSIIREIFSYRKEVAKIFFSIQFKGLNRIRQRCWNRCSRGLYQQDRSTRSQQCKTSVCRMGPQRPAAGKEIKFIDHVLVLMEFAFYRMNASPCTQSLRMCKLNLGQVHQGICICKLGTSFWIKNSLEIGMAYALDPISDLLPVVPNCSCV